MLDSKKEGNGGLRPHLFQTLLVDVPITSFTSSILLNLQVKQYTFSKTNMNLLYYDFTRSRQLHIHDWNTQLRETCQVIVLGKHEWSTMIIPEWWICKLLSSSPFVCPMMIASPLLEKSLPPKPWVEASLYRISKPTNHERIVDLDRSSKQVKTTPMQV